MKDRVKKHVQKLHYTLNENSFNRKWVSFQEKFSNSEAGLNFIAYFNRQWVAQGSFATWRSFDSPPGYCKTNNSLESNNNTLKTVYSTLKTASIATLVNKLSSALRDCAQIPVIATPNFDSKLLAKANSNNNLVNIQRLVLLGVSNCVITRDANNPESARVHDLTATCTITGQHVTCNCRTFARDLKCWHILAAAKRANLPLPPGWPSQQTLLRVGRAGRPRGARPRPRGGPNQFNNRRGNQRGRAEDARGNRRDN